MQLRSIQKYLKFLVFVPFFTGPLSARAQYAAEEGGSPSNSPTFKLTGDVALLSHYVKDGLSQTNKDPALQGSFWFNFGPQFRMGLWGSNVNYENSSDHFNLDAKAEIRIDFNQTANALLQYSQNQYYKVGDRNGNTLALLINLSKFRIRYSKESNWEATHEKSSRYELGLESDVFSNWKWDNEVGYNTPDVSNIDTYFDFRTGLGRKFGVIFLEGAVTATSSPGQFNGAGDVFIILSASTQL